MQRGMKIMNINYINLWTESLIAGQRAQGELPPLCRALARAATAQQLCLSHTEMPYYTQISLFSLMHFSPQWPFFSVLHSDPSVPSSPPRPGGRDRPGCFHFLRCPGRPSAHHNLGQGTWGFHTTGDRDGSFRGELNNSLLQHLSQLQEFCNTHG